MVSGVWDDTQPHRQESGLISLFLVFQNKKIMLKMASSLDENLI
jgi:hypothetical protein